VAQIEYFIRHAESKANTESIYQGQTYDTYLSPLGMKQAEAAAVAIGEQREIQAIFVSPLKRTFQTAAIIAQTLMVPIIPDRRLLEINHGSWEGKTVREFTPEEVKILEEWKSQPHRCQMPNGEYFYDVVKRAEEFLRELKNKTGQFAIVTHDLFLRVIICKIGDLPYENIWQLTLDNCGITTLSVNPDKIISVNANNHLINLHPEVNKQVL